MPVVGISAFFGVTVNIMFILKQAIAAILFKIGHVVSPHDILDVEETEDHTVLVAAARGGTKTFRFSREADRLELLQSIITVGRASAIDEIMVTTENGADLWVNSLTGLFYNDGKAIGRMPANGIRPVMLARPLPEPGMYQLKNLSYYGYDASGFLVIVTPG